MIVHVRVKQGKCEPVEDGGILYLCTSEKRENNRANLDLVKQIARFYNTETSRVKLITGMRSRKKTFSVD